MIQQVTKSVYVETEVIMCNLGLITTKEGTVLIDTPIRPSDSLRWRDEAQKKGEIKYVINTEVHPDHSAGVQFFPGVYISHRETRDNLASASIETFRSILRRDKTASQSLIQDYRIRLADAAFDGSLDLHLGELTLKMFNLPGHVPGGIGVYVPEERVVFTGDIVFHRVKTFLSEADPEKWLDSLGKIEALDADFVVPGHGGLCNKTYLKEQADIVRNWYDRVRAAFESGQSETEAETNVVSPDPYELQPGSSFTAADVNKGSISRLYALAKKRSLEKRESGNGNLKYTSNMPPVPAG